MRGNGNGEARSEGQEAAGTVVDLFEQRARDNDDGRGAGNGGRGNGDGRGSGNGGGSGGGSDGGGDDLGPVDGRILLSSLRQMAEFASTCAMTAAERTLTVVKDERLARQDEALAMAKQLGEEITRGLHVNARLAEATADAFAAFDARIKRLEAVTLELLRERAERNGGGSL